MTNEFEDRLRGRDSSYSHERERARRVAQQYLTTHPELGQGLAIRDVYSLEEIDFRRPAIYAQLENCWIAYVERPHSGLVSSMIVVVSKNSGEVVYAGSANDEG
jgi:hypothetical protein